MWSRLPALLAASTSIFGSILKIDSTKKICKKLQGAAANTASWATNVSNERGEVLISILTESEGEDGLQKMATGLMCRYQQAGIEPPILLYTDRDCCCRSGPSKYQVTIICSTSIAVKRGCTYVHTYIHIICTQNPMVIIFADSFFQLGWTTGPSRHLALHEEVGQGVH